MYEPLSAELASLLELAEAEWNRAKLESLQQEADNSRGVEFAQFGQIQAMVVSSLSHNPSYNRVFHITSRDKLEIASAIRWCHDRRARFWLDVVPPLADGEVLGIFAKSDLALIRFSDTVFMQPSDLTHLRKSQVQIYTVESVDQFHQYARVLSSAFSIPKEILDQTAAFLQVEFSSSLVAATRRSGRGRSRIGRESVFGRDRCVDIEHGDRTGSPKKGAADRNSQGVCLVRTR